MKGVISRLEEFHCFGDFWQDSAEWASALKLNPSPEDAQRKKEEKNPTEKLGHRRINCHSSKALLPPSIPSRLASIAPHYLLPTHLLKPPLPPAPRARADTAVPVCARGRGRCRGLSRGTRD